MDDIETMPASLSELSKRRAPPGARPGTLIPNPDGHPPAIHAIAFDAQRLEENDVDDVRCLPDLVGRFPVIWINVDGLGDMETIKRLGETFNIHHLALEDIVNVHQRPKAEEYEDHLFIVTRMIVPSRQVVTEQVFIFVGEGFVLSFQERPGDCFDLVRERLRRRSGRIRELEKDYLAYGHCQTGSLRRPAQFCLTVPPGLLNQSLKSLPTSVRRENSRGTSSPRSSLTLSFDARLIALVRIGGFPDNRLFQP